MHSIPWPSFPVVDIIMLLYIFPFYCEMYHIHRRVYKMHKHSLRNNYKMKSCNIQTRSKHYQHCVPLWLYLLFKIFKECILFILGCVGSSLLCQCFLKLQRARAALLLCVSPSLPCLLLLRSTGSRRAGFIVVAWRLRYPEACGFSLDQVLNPWPLHWQADS